MAGAHDLVAPVVHPWRAAPPLRTQSGSQPKWLTAPGIRRTGEAWPYTVSDGPAQFRGNANQTRYPQAARSRSAKLPPFCSPNNTGRWHAGCRPSRGPHLPAQRPPSGNRSAGQARPLPSPPPRAAHRAGTAGAGKARTSQPRAGESRDAERTARVHKIDHATSRTTDAAGDVGASDRARISETGTTTRRLTRGEPNTTPRCTVVQVLFTAADLRQTGSRRSNRWQWQRS